MTKPPRIACPRLSMSTSITRERNQSTSSNTNSRLGPSNSNGRARSTGYRPSSFHEEEVFLNPGDESEWDEGSEVEEDDDDENTSDMMIEVDRKRRRTGSGNILQKKKKDEPMSPISVVLYVVFFYIIWQILTRTDDQEILSHLGPSTSSLLTNHHIPELPHLNYPYQMPHIPSPLPSLSTVNNVTESSDSLWRVIFGVLVYPLWLIYTIVITPLPLVVILLTGLLNVILVLLSPFMAVGRACFDTFVRGPWNLFSGVMRMLYPIWMFVGGVLGVGTVLGLCVGWVGRTGLRYLINLFHGRKHRSRKSRHHHRSGNGNGNGNGNSRSSRSSNSKSTISSTTGILNRQIPYQPEYELNLNESKQRDVNQQHPYLITTGHGKLDSDIPKIPIRPSQNSHMYTAQTGPEPEPEHDHEHEHDLKYDHQKAYRMLKSQRSPSSTFSAADIQLQTPGMKSVQRQPPTSSSTTPVGNGKVHYFPRLGSGGHRRSFHVTERDEVDDEDEDDHGLDDYLYENRNGTIKARKNGGGGGGTDPVVIGIRRRQKKAY